MIWALNGKIASGKSTVAKMLAEELHKSGYTVEHKMFAFKIKQFVELLTGEKMEVDKDNYFNGGIVDFTHEQKNKFFPQYGYTIGQMLQKIGTDMFRDMFHKDTWIESMFIDYKKNVDTMAYFQKLGDTLGNHISGKKTNFDHDKLIEPQYPNWIIADTRFPNEAERIIKEGGFVVSVVGDPTNETKNGSRSNTHESEIAMDNHDHLKKYIIQNDGTLQDLENKVKDIIDKEFERNG